MYIVDSNFHQSFHCDTAVINALNLLSGKKIPSALKEWVHKNKTTGISNEAIVRVRFSRKKIK